MKLFKKSTTSKTRRPRNRGLRCEPLERRDLLSISMSGDELRIVGGAGADTAQVQIVGDQVRATLNAETFNVSLASVRSIRFTGGDGNDTFDNGTSIRATAYGDAGNDVLCGGGGGDALYGGAGRDTLEGRGGGDVLDGGDGNDSLTGGDGADTLWGQAGNDTLSGGNANDTLYGGNDVDTLNGDAGDDFLGGGNGNDSLSGGTGNDTLYGDAGDDFLRGNSDNDELNGGDNNDTLYGEFGNDSLSGNAGNDSLYGGAGNDTLRGNDGEDLLLGEADNDSLYGGNQNDKLDGGAGDDSLSGNDGNDYLCGGLGSDSLYGGGGNDGLFGGVDVGVADRLRGEGGDDRFLTRTILDGYEDLADNDVRIRFNSGSSDWTEREVQNIDQAFAELQARTGSTRVLKDTIADGPLTFVKESSAVDYAGLNEYWEEWDWDDVHMDHNRLIHIADWNEANNSDNAAYRGVAIHEIAHNWDSSDEARHHPGGRTYWSDFQNFHDASHEHADYARAYGETNIREDFATCWEVAMGYTARRADASAVLLAKLAAVDACLASFV